MGSTMQKFCQDTMRSLSVMPSNFDIGVSVVSSFSIIKLKIRVIANAYIDVRRLIRNAKMQRMR
jgi:hypothetical protein